MNSARPWYILLLPFFAAVVIVLITKSYRGLSSFISVATVLGSFGCSCVVFVTPNIRALELTWIDLPPLLYVPLGLVLDDLNPSFPSLLRKGAQPSTIVSLPH